MIVMAFGGFQAFPTVIQSLHVKGERIFVGDLCEGFHCVKYRRHDQFLHIFAESSSPRYLTSSLVLDYDTMVHAVHTLHRHRQTDKERGTITGF